MLHKTLSKSILGQPKRHDLTSMQRASESILTVHSTAQSFLGPYLFICKHQSLVKLLRLLQNSTWCRGCDPSVHSSVRLELRELCAAGLHLHPCN